MFRHVIYSNVACTHDNVLFDVVLLYVDTTWDLNSWLESLAGVILWLAGVFFLAGWSCFLAGWRRMVRGGRCEA